jgi:hypothetical protein
MTRLLVLSACALALAATQVCAQNSGVTQGPQSPASQVYQGDTLADAAAKIPCKNLKQQPDKSWAATDATIVVAQQEHQNPTFAGPDADALAKRCHSSPSSLTLMGVGH